MSRFRNPFRLMFSLNIYRRLFHLKKREVIYYVLRVWLRISLGESYASAKNFRKITNYWFIQKFGVMTLENELGIQNRACFDMEESLSNSRAEYKTKTKSVYKDKHRLYYLLKLKNKDGISNEDAYMRSVQELEFEKTSFSEATTLFKDNVHTTCCGYSPKRKNPKEIQLVNKLNSVIHDLTAEKASITQSQLTRRKVQGLPKAKEVPAPEEPETKNILGYTNGQTANYIKFCLVIAYLSELLIFQNIFFHNVGLSEVKSYLVSGSILGVTFGISRLIFNKAERLLRTIKKQWIIVTVASIIFFTQLAISGSLTYYNVQRKIQTELLQEDKEQQAMNQGELYDLDEDDSEEIAKLESKKSELESDIKTRSESLKTIPFLAKYAGYVLIALTSIIVLFFTVILKVHSEVYSHVAKLKKNIKNNEERLEKIEENYPKEVIQLETAYNTRHHFAYYLAKKHVLELLLAQEDELSTEEFYRKYNLND